jgi:hypothetical protein
VKNWVVLHCTLGGGFSTPDMWKCCYLPQARSSLLLVLWIYCSLFHHISPPSC